MNRRDVLKAAGAGPLLALFGPRPALPVTARTEALRKQFRAGAISRKEWREIEAKADAARSGDRPQPR